MPTQFKDALELLEARKYQIGVPDPDDYIDRLKKYLKFEPEDSRRAAVLIAVDASKNLISIGVAFFAALGAFVLNFRLNRGSFFSLVVASIGCCLANDCEHVRWLYCHRKSL